MHTHDTIFLTHATRINRLTTQLYIFDKILNSFIIGLS